MVSQNSNKYAHVQLNMYFLSTLQCTFGHVGICTRPAVNVHVANFL